MLQRLVRSKVVRVLVSAWLITVLVLPSGALIPSLPVQAISGSRPLAQEDELGQAVPTPEPLLVWPDVSSLPQYTPSFDPLPEPANEPLETDVYAATAEEVAAVDTEAGKTGVVSGVAVASLVPAGGLAQLNALQLTLRSEPGAVTEPIVVQAEVLPEAEASQWSPVGMAFRLQFGPHYSRGCGGQCFSCSAPTDLAYARL